MRWPAYLWSSLRENPPIIFAASALERQHNSDNWYILARYQDRWLKHQPQEPPTAEQIRSFVSSWVFPSTPFCQNLVCLFFFSCSLSHLQSKVNFGPDKAPHLACGHIFTSRKEKNGEARTSPLHLHFRPEPRFLLFYTLNHVRGHAGQLARPHQLLCSLRRLRLPRLENWCRGQRRPALSISAGGKARSESFSQPTMFSSNI